MKVNTYTKTGSKATTQATLDKGVFENVPESTTLIAQTYEANRRGARTANAIAKTRGEVRGGGRKPWRQKGTGRARAGTIRSPLWKGGGVTFGPTGEQSFNKVSKTSRKVALKQALSLAAKSGRVSVIESFDVTSGKTKDAAAIIDKLDLTGKITVVVDELSDKTAHATRNIADLTVMQADRINVNDVLDSGNIVLTKKALDVLTSRLGVSNE